MHSYDIPKHSTAILGGLILLIWYAATLLQRKWRQNCFVRENQCKPPSQLPSKLLGLDIILQTIAAAKQRRVLELGLSRFQHYGNTLKFRNLTKTMITTREPQNIKTILSVRFKDYSLGDRIQTFGPLLGHGIFTTDGEHWAQSRSMVRSGFSKDRIAHLDIFEELMGDLFELIPTDGSTVDLQDLFFCYTMDSATDFLFGHSVRALKKYGHNPGDETGQDFGSAFNYAQDSIATRVRMGPLKFLHRDRKAQDANRRCHELAEEFVDKALSYRQTLNENGSAGDDTSAEKSKSLFLHKLAQQTGDRTRIRDELMNVLLAGRDTTASLLSNMFFVLAKKPEIWAKLQGEIAVLEGRAPTYDQLRNLTYLKYCMNESLRLHPVVPVNARLAVVDTVLPVGGGRDGQSPVFVPKGTTVRYSLYSMHRREDFYGPDAQEYRPERWEKLRMGWEYLPFNGGPRICVGQQYALTEAAYVTVRLAQKFPILESRDPGSWKENLTLTLCSHNGCHVSLQHA